MYIYGEGDQPLGFRLISLVIVDWDDVSPILYRCVDGALPRQEADAEIRNCGGGQYVAILSAGDTSGDKITYQLEADNCVPDEKTICFFRSSALPFSISVEAFPAGTLYPSTVRLQFDDATAFVLSQTVAGRVVVGIADATGTTRGLLTAAAQTIGGDKQFTDKVYLHSNGSTSYLTLDRAGAPGYTRLSGGPENSSLFTLEASSGSGTELRLVSTIGPFQGLILDGVESPGPWPLLYYGIRDNAGVIQQGRNFTLPGGATVTGGIVTGIGSGSSLPWAYISGAPTTLAGYGITSPLPLAEGGSGAALGAAGPGVWNQATAGAAVSPLAPAADGDVLTGAAGAWTSARPHGYPLDYVEVYAGGSFSGHTEGAAVALLTGGTLAYDGSVVRVELFIPRVQSSSGTAQTAFFIQDDLGNLYGQFGLTPGAQGQSFTAVQYVAVANGATQITLMGFNSAGTTTWAAGAGGAGVLVPAFLRQTVP